MRQQQAKFWSAEADIWRAIVVAGYADLKKHRESREGAWEIWRAELRIAKSSARRGSSISEIGPLLDQWSERNPDPTTIRATDEGRFEWNCPVAGHVFPAVPKNRYQKETACPECLKTGVVRDIPQLAAQLSNPADAEQGLSDRNLRWWVHRTWAVDPATGAWREWEHRFQASVHERVQQQDRCLTCAGAQGGVIDDSTSLAGWYPDLAAELASGHDAGAIRAVEKTEVIWRCTAGKRHPEYPASVLNRAYGNGCPLCQPTVSRPQAGLAAELGSVMTRVEPDDRDPRLPFDVPDLNSIQYPIPAELRSRYSRRYATVEIDILLKFPDGRVLAVEYDGEHHHKRRREQEGVKEAILGELGIPLIRVRQGKLIPVNGVGVTSVHVPVGIASHEAAIAVLAEAEKRLGASIPGLASYRKLDKDMAALAADAFLSAIGNAKRPRKKAPPKERAAQSPRDPLPVGYRSGHVVVASEVYLDPDRYSERWVYDVRCDCSCERTVAIPHARFKHQPPKICSRGCPLREMDTQSIPALEAKVSRLKAEVESIKERMGVLS